jgi:hypothetical protein
VQNNLTRAATDPSLTIHGQRRKTKVEKEESGVFSVDFCRRKTSEIERRKVTRGRYFRILIKIPCNETVRFLT